MFVDASAIVAILTREAEADGLADRLQGATDPMTSPIAVFEATLAVRRKRRLSLHLAHEAVVEFLQLTGTRIVPVSEADGETALAAFGRYGKGQGHPAQLNLADCFAYAAAVNHGTALLFTGEDFAHTDLATRHGP